MGDTSIKIKIHVAAGSAQRAIRLTTKDLQALASAGKAVKSETTGASAAAASAVRVYGGLSAAINRASAAVSLFNRALGLLGVVSSIFAAAASLWTAFSDHAKVAAERQEKANRKLSDARKKVEDLNQARLDKARQAMRSFSDEIARARDNANALVASVAALNAAQADYNAAKIDVEVAQGNKTKEQAAYEKARLATQAAFDAAESDTAVAFSKKRAADDVVNGYLDKYPELARLGFEDGHLDTFYSEAAKKFRSADNRYNADKHWNDPDVAESGHKRELARQEYAAFVQVAREYEDAVAAAQRAANEYEAAKIKGDATVNKALAEELRIRKEAGKDSADALEKSVRDLAKSKIDLDVQQGTKSQKVGELEKQKLDLEAELKAATEAVESRRAELEKTGQDTETDTVLAALNNVLETIRNKMDINTARMETADSPERPRKGPAMTISSDRWGRIGAFAGNGSQAESLNIQKGSYDALKAIRTMCDRIHRSMRYQNIAIL